MIAAQMALARNERDGSGNWESNCSGSRPNCLSLPRLVNEFDTDESSMGSIRLGTIRNRQL